jgi:hypothetical protein
MSLPTKENPFKFENKEEHFQKPLSELDHVQKIGKQLNILERISNTTDPWEDINLFKYIKSSYHENILSGRKIRRIEFIAKRYLFSDDTLLYRCNFDI